MKHTAKKCILLLAGLALAAVLSGCTFFDSSVEQLFTLPRMAEEYTGLSQQIDSLIDQGYEYASPSGGRNIQSVQMVDLEDDGIQEALVFLRRSSDEKPLKIMVFRLEGDTYRCFCTIESSGSAVDSVYYQDLNGDGCREIIVGWRISADVQTLAAYTVESEPVALMSSGYTQFSVQDLNGDGVVDSYDVKPIGYTAIPEIVYGFGFSLQWKAFDFSAFFQGVGHVNFSTRTDQTQGFIARNSREANLFSDVYDNYWTPERLDAKYPRLFIGTNNNNNQNSSFWMANGRYMRLKNLEIGYTLPKHISQKMAMQNMRVYLSGVNLFTFSPFKLWDPDLQTGATNYPNNRIINIGLTIGF